MQLHANRLPAFSSMKFYRPTTKKKSCLPVSQDAAPNERARRITFTVRMKRDADQRVGTVAEAGAPEVPGRRAGNAPPVAQTAESNVHALSSPRVSISN